ncbi:hypothetical protein N0V93_008260 [Gnomoniopsis smithogilvyi]|uniref:Uncharacterized protein n=1 Tax=Gnomoniopsis smithogilvyi TaxID=1191159 RepID=A0A9W9CUK6_9PEZI|nr:hypothetical protein N0V93_008260 [Gnomoniopsis smithogilvyi]
MQSCSNSNPLCGHQAPDSNKNTPSQSPSNDNPPPDSIKNDYEKDMAVFFAYYQRSAYGVNCSAGGKASAPPSSPAAPAFTPRGSNNAARAEAMKRIHSERRLRKLKKEERELREQKQRLEVEKVWKASMEEVEKASQTVPSSPSAGSVGSWTEDEAFIPNIKA